MFLSNGNQGLSDRWRNTLLLVTGALLCGALLLAANWEADRRERLRLDNFRGDIADLARLAEAVIGGQIRDFDATLLMLRAAYVDDPEFFPTYLELFRRGHLADRTVLVVMVAREGQLAYTDTPTVTPGMYLGDRKYFRYFADGGQDSLYIDEPTLGRVTKRYTLPLVRPMYDKQGDFSGIAALSVTQASLSQMGSLPQLSADTAITVIMHDGAVVSRSRELAEVQGTKISSELLTPLLKAPEGVFINRSSADGVERVIAFRHIEYQASQLIVYVESSLDEVRADIAGQRRLLHWSAGFFSLFIMSLIAVYLRGRKISGQLVDSLRRSKAQEYAALTETALDGFWISDKSGRMLDANASLCNMLGYSKAELLGLNLMDFEFSASFNAHLRQTQDTGSARFVSRHRRKDGSCLDVEISARYVSELAGQFFVFVRDITEAKVHEAVHQQAGHLLQLANLHNDPHDCLAALTESLKSWSGCEGVGIRMREGDDFPYCETRGFPADFVCAENRLCAYGPDGNIMRDGEGKPVLECMCGKVLSGRFDPSLPFFSSRGSFWSNHSSVLLAATTDAEQLAHPRNRCNAEGYESVALIPLRAGERIVGLLQFNDHRPNCFTVALIETFERMADSLALTLERRRVEAELRQSEKRFRILLNNIPDLIWLKDTEGVYLTCNAMFERCLGAKETDIIGKTDYDFFDQELADFFRENDLMAMAAGKPCSNEEWATFAYDGHRALLYKTKMAIHDAEGKIIGVLGVGRDISMLKQAEEERIKLESQLHQAQKVESIGLLAGGVAHDFNNMLSVILGYAALALRKTDPGNPVYSNLEEISRAATRSADLTRQLLTFARKQVIAPKVLDLNEAVAGMLKMLQRLIGENIQLSWLPAPDLWSVMMDPSQLDQILANLCVNARDAIAGTGKISIETENSTRAQNYTVDHPYVIPGDYVRLSVSDDGFGMDAETRTHIFEPFFTTKELSTGTGLGLATVFGAVKQNHGFVNVYSEPGHGTTFNLYLPRTLAEGEEVQTATEAPLRQGTETVLLVEDDKMLLQMIKLMLESAGYRVLPAATPDRAESLFLEYAEPIHLLLTDLIMPGMNGKELSEKLQALRPELKVIFMSGYTADIIAKQGVVEAGVHFLQKPVSFAALTTKVRQVLDYY